MWKPLGHCVRSPAVLIVLKFQTTGYGELPSAFVSVEAYTRRSKNYQQCLSLH